MRKCLKKRRLIKKYTPTTKSMLNDLHLLRIDPEIRSYLTHIRHCELRFLNRIKRL